MKLFKVANENNQTIGERRDLYVTLEDVHSAMLRIVEEEGGAL